nr:TetR/AcrR family transcriptional regulator [Massilia terrae]
MTTRPYDNTTRKTAQAETTRRIIEAAIALHAERGGMATTHADIAARSGVSVATVYKHFPSRESLLPHCMGAVAKDAPSLEPRQLLAIQGTAERIAALVRALHERYRYFHPWTRWTARDAASLPLLAEAARTAQQETEAMIRAVLESCAGAPLSAETLTLAYVLLGYPAWQRLDADLSDPERVGRAIEQVVTLLIPKANA